VRARALDAVIWTAIRPRYPIGPTFSAADAIEYLRSLEDPLRTEALDYVRSWNLQLS
jgi:hypothetical protein